jgi:aminoglycoside phosphotransferase (APT) family kinase protein
VKVEKNNWRRIMFGDETILAVSKEFQRILKEWMTPEEWQQMIALNLKEKSQFICHSHDFCDANVAMLQAVINVLDLEVDSHGDPIEDIDKLFNLMGDAWNLFSKEIGQGTVFKS